MGTGKKTTLGRMEFYAGGFCRDALSTDSSKIEGIEGNREISSGEIRLNPATIASAVFYLRHHGLITFQRVAVLAIGLVRKGAVNDSRLCITGIFSHIFSPHGTDFPFQIYRTHTHAHRHRKMKSKLLL